MRIILGISCVLAILCTLAFALPSVRSVHPPEEPIAHSYSDVLPPELLNQLHKDCLAVTEWERTMSSLKNNKYRTRWLPINQEPQTSIELAIQYLKKIIKPPSNIVGAEWWIQHVPAGPRGSIIWHVDKDESIASNKHYLSHPHTASILYLTDIGGPTVITEQWSPEGMGYSPTVAQEGVISYPKTNKYTVFQGELLHGVMPGRPTDTGFRMTFLVNWWTYKPEEPNCSPLPHHQVPNLKLFSQAELAVFQSGFTRPTPGYNYVHDRGQLDAFEPVAAPAGILNMASVDSYHIDIPTAAKLAASQAQPFKLPSPKPTPSYIYTYSLPGGRTDQFRAPRDWFNGETLRLVWDTRVESNLVNREMNRVNTYIHRLSQFHQGVEITQYVKPATSQPTQETASNAPPNARMTAQQARQQRRQRDQELLLKSEL